MVAVEPPMVEEGLLPALVLSFAKTSSGTGRSGRAICAAGGRIVVVGAGAAVGENIIGIACFGRRAIPATWWLACNLAGGVASIAVVVGRAARSTWV